MPLLRLPVINSVPLENLIKHEQTKLLVFYGIQTSLDTFFFFNAV